MLCFVRTIDGEDPRGDLSPEALQYKFFTPKYIIIVVPLLDNAGHSTLPNLVIIMKQVEYVIRSFKM